VGEVTFSALASEPTRTSLYGDPTTPIPHTYLGRLADLIVVAPATAHLIARYAIGLADDLLTATLLATDAPVLRARRCTPRCGNSRRSKKILRCFAAVVSRARTRVRTPRGRRRRRRRMAEPAAIFELVQRILRGYRGPLSGRRVLISAGGTREAIDPVRVIANRSSGRQGYALAEVARRLGADVTLVTTLERPLALDVASSIEVLRVESAQQLHDTMIDRASDSDCIIMAAAVTDFTVEPSSVKLKKDAGVRRCTSS